MNSLKRSELVEELNLAKEESKNLAEMITLLGHTLDEARLRQLRIEQLVMNKRVVRLGADILRLDASGGASAAA